jgi:hypothetical protein
MKFISFVEVYEDSSPNPKCCLREVYISKEHIVTLREDNVLKIKLKDGELPEGMEQQQEFTKIEINLGGTFSRVIRVVGDVDSVSKKLNWCDKNVI